MFTAVIAAIHAGHLFAGACREALQLAEEAAESQGGGVGHLPRALASASVALPHVLSGMPCVLDILPVLPCLPDVLPDLSCALHVQSGGPCGPCVLPGLSCVPDVLLVCPVCLKFHEVCPACLILCQFCPVCLMSCWASPLSKTQVAEILDSEGSELVNNVEVVLQA